MTSDEHSRAIGKMQKERGGKHPGFAKVQSQIAKKEGVSEDRAGAILAASSRNASAAAKKKNPRLKKVGGSDNY